MKLDGTEDLRVQKTIEAIRSTFEAMICEMDFNKITVKELCERARINKKTFYRYYPTIYDLLAEVQGEISKEYIERTANMKLPEDAEKIAREFCLFSAEQDDMYEKITCNSDYHQIRQQMIDTVVTSGTDERQGFTGWDPAVASIAKAFMQSGGLEAYRQWIADGKQVPAETLADIVGTLTARGIEGLPKTR